MRRILVVEDDLSLNRALVRVLRDWSAEVEHASTRAAALEKLRPPLDLVVIDIRLPDGSGLDVARAASQLLPKPPILAISGEATPHEAFELARIGVRGFLPKPVSLEGLRPTIQSILDNPPPLVASAFVGVMSIHDVQESVRRSMVEQALSIAGGNKTEAARLLGVSRQAVQQMIKDLELEVPPTDSPPTSRKH